MAAVTQSYNLDVIPGGAPVVVHVHQGDLTARAFSLNLFSRNGQLTIPSGASAYIEGLKPDGKSFSYKATLSGTVVTIDMKAQMTVLSGDVRCQCKIVSGSQIIISANFIMRVERDNTVDADTSETDIPGMVQQAQAAAQEAQEAADNIDESWFIDGAKNTSVSTYNTSAKTTVGAINEHESDITTVKSDISSINSNLTNTYQWKGTLPNDTDLNTVISPGRYYVNGSNTYTNMPSGMTYGHFEVLRAGAFGTAIVQRISANGGVMATRLTANGGSTWGDWVRFMGAMSSGTLTASGGTLSAVSVRKTGQLVVFQGQFTATQAIAINTYGLVTFPEGYRPANALVVVAQLSTSPYFTNLFIASDGRGQVLGNPIPNGGIMRFSGSFYSP